MNSLVSSLRLISRSGVVLRAFPRTLATRALAPVCTRGFATKKTIDVVNEKQKKNEFVRMLDEEASVLRTSLADEESNNTSPEFQERFLKETGFKFTEEKEEGLIKLTRSQGDKTVEVTFSNSPEDYDEEPEEDVDAEEEEGETDAEEKGEEGEDHENEGTGVEREHAFTVEVKSNAEGAVPFMFQCFAKSDGSFIVNKMTHGDKIPVQISYWNDDLQRELIQYLETVGVNERLSNFIHQYLDRQETQDNLEVIEKFRDFVQSK